MKKLTNITLLKISMVSVFIAAVFTSCVKDTPDDQAPELTQKVNTFIEDAMKDVYLWEANLPSIDVKYEFDSKAYFEKLLYEEDKWSFITDDIDALEASFNGVETSFGYSLAFGRFSNTGNLFALIEYVYPNSPAEQAGLKRGDIIVLIDGADITESNYMDLFNGSTITLTMGVLSNGSIGQGGTVTVTSEILNLDPVMITDIIEQGGHKIGYLFYAQFISNYNSSLDDAFQYFKNNNVTDLVLDIRYNPGGYMSAAQHLCSSVAPQSAISAGDVLVTMQWNEYYQNYWETEGVESQIRMNFLTTPTVNLDFSKIYILTGSGSASASELTITGLDPYMDVVLIGDTTYGKYTGSITLKPEDLYTSASYYSDFDNWGIQPIVLRYANANGVTNFKNGFAPDFYVYDDLWTGVPLNDPNDPLLAKAIEQITGTVPSATYKRAAAPDYQLIGRAASRFANAKRQLIDDLPRTVKK